MKKQSPGIFLLVLLAGSLLFFPSCKKINEATDLGGSLIPPVDNITTFETLLSTQTNNLLLNDTTHLKFGNFPAVIGHIGNDPEFGATDAAAYFNLGLGTYGSNPFTSQGTIIGMDSVVLSLWYAGSFGDTVVPQTFRVYEIDPASNFFDTTQYTYSQPDFPTQTELGSKTFAFQSLKDTIQLIRKADTQRVANVLRIRLDNALGSRLAGLDASAYQTDSAFKSTFRGLAVKADASAGNGLGFFSLINTTARLNTFLTVYFRVNRDGKADTTAVNFVHNQRRKASGQLAYGGFANTIRRTPAGNWNTALQNGTTEDPLVYVQSQPGSHATVKIPGLDSLAGTSRLIHLAELIVPRVPSASDGLFPSPSMLFLDRMSAAGDTLFKMERDLPALTSAYFAAFGGALRTDSTYRFNITKYVQDVANGRLPANHILRLSAPYRTVLYDRTTGEKQEIFVGDLPAGGRVVVGGGNYADPARRTRLRIIYSKTQP